MSKIFISRPDSGTPWGFRLQGGLEFGEPLTVTNIVPNSPSDGKIDPSDTIIEIAGQNVTQISHREALELIQRCGNALFLTVHKIGFSYPAGGNASRSAPMPSMWRPASSSHQIETNPPAPFSQQTQSQLQQQQQQQHQNQYFQYDFQQQTSANIGAPVTAPPPPPPPPPPPLAPSLLEMAPANNIPPAPVFDAEMIANAAASLKSRPAPDESRASREQSSDGANVPAALAKSLGRAGGPKPFTYTPGGLDLSKIRESARVRRHREYTSNSEEPVETIDSKIEMNRRVNVPAETIPQPKYVPPSPNQTFMHGRQQATPPPKKHIQHDPDVVTQSRSFQMLKGWISDSEKIEAPAKIQENPPTQPQPQNQTKPINRSAVAQAVLDEQQTRTDRRRNSSGTGSLPSRTFRYLQDQYTEDNPVVVKMNIEETKKTDGDGSGLRRGSNHHLPSRAFKYLQDQYDAQEGPVNRTQGVNNRDDLAEIYNKPPPSVREREPEAPRYTGSTVPSRSFRFLQMMTSGDDQNQEQSSVGSYVKSQTMRVTPTNNVNKYETHPSRSFKFLQEMTTGEREQAPMNNLQSTSNSFNHGNTVRMNIAVQPSAPIVQVNSTSCSSQSTATTRQFEEIDATDF